MGCKSGGAHSLECCLLVWLRLASLSGRISELEAEHQQLKGQAEDLGSGNCAMKAEYDALRERYQLREGELRRAAEKEQELIESLVRKKVEAAEHQNKKNERLVKGLSLPSV